MRRRTKTSKVMLYIFLLIAIIVGNGVYFLDIYGEEGLYREILIGVFLMSCGSMILSITITSINDFVRIVREHKCSGKSITLLVVKSIFFSIAIFLTFRLGIKTIYKSSYDLLKSDTANIILSECSVVEESTNKGTPNYFLKGMDSDNVNKSFKINYQTYELYGNKKGAIVKVVCYRKSRVVISIEEISSLGQ